MKLYYCLIFKKINNLFKKKNMKLLQTNIQENKQFI